MLTRAAYRDKILFVELIQFNAALAQLVERRLGKAEVGGSNPLGSSLNRSIVRYFGFFALYSIFCYKELVKMRLVFFIRIRSRLFFGKRYKKADSGYS